MDRTELLMRLREADHFGGLHIVVGDLNTDDDNVRAVLTCDYATAEDREIAAALLEMGDEDWRHSILLEAERLP